MPSTSWIRRLIVKIREIPLIRRAPLKERDIVKIVTVMRKVRKWERMINGLSDKSMGNPDKGSGDEALG